MPGFAFRIGVYYAAVFSFTGVHLPFFPAWLASLGYGATAIGLLVGLPVILRVPFSLLVSVMADAIGDRRAPIVALSATGALASVVFVAWPAVWPVAVATCVIAVTIGAVIPLTDALAMSGERETRSGYGRIRLWGSIAFIAANIAGGALIGRLGTGAVPWWILITLAVSTMSAVALPRGCIGPGEVAIQQPRARWLAGLPLLRSRVFLAFVIGVGAAQAAHGLLYTFASIHWKAIGHDGTLIGIFWAIGVVGEVVFFAFSRQIFAVVSPGGLLLLSSAVTAVRMAAMAFDPPLALLIALQASHAVTFGAMHLGVIHFVNEAVPDRLAATAQGLFSALAIGIVGGLSLLVSGPLYHGFGAHGFLASALMACLGVAAALFVLGRWDRRAVM